jgi:uncharacterized protein
VATRTPPAAFAFVALLLWPPVSFAGMAHPSFACSGSLNPTETAICTDESLAALDRTVTTAYRNKFDGLPVESADALDQLVKSLIITQKAWTAHRNSCGADHTCIYRAYRIRKAALTSGDDAKAVSCRDMVGIEQAAVYVKDCIAVGSETHPPCNADNACELIVSHNIFRCAGLGDGAPKFCAAYTKP